MAPLLGKQKRPPPPTRWQRPLTDRLRRLRRSWWSSGRNEPQQPPRRLACWACSEQLLAFAQTPEKLQPKPSPQVPAILGEAGIFERCCRNDEWLCRHRNPQLAGAAPSRSSGLG